jgi:hypothetical protein
MGYYHETLVARGVPAIGLGFSDLRPANVAEREFETPATDRTFGPDFTYCDQKVTGWIRTDVTYESQCEEVEIDSRNGYLAGDATPQEFRVKKKVVKLPGFKDDLAEKLAEDRGIPIAPKDVSTGQVALAINNLTNGRTISSNTPVQGTVNPIRLKNWKLEIGRGSNPEEWTTLGEGTQQLDNAVLGVIQVADLEDGVYTVRLSTDDGKGLMVSVLINLRKDGSLPGFPGNPGPGNSQNPGGGNQNPGGGSPNQGGSGPQIGPDGTIIQN